MGEEKIEIPEKVREILKDVVVFRAEKYDPKKNELTEIFHIGFRDTLKADSGRYLRRGWSVICDNIEVDPDEQKLCDELRESVHDLDKSYEYLKREMAPHLTPEFRADREATIARRKKELRVEEEKLAKIKEKFYDCVLRGKRGT